MRKWVGMRVRIAKARKVRTLSGWTRGFVAGKWEPSRRPQAIERAAANLCNEVWHRTVRIASEAVNFYALACRPPAELFRPPDSQIRRQAYQTTAARGRLGLVGAVSKFKQLQQTLPNHFAVAEIPQLAALQSKLH